MEKPVPIITKEALRQQFREKGLVIIDLRLNWDSSQTKIKQAQHEDAARIKEWSKNYSKNLNIVLYCSTPQQKTSADAARYLIEQGYRDVKVLQGGWAVWESSGFPTQKTTKEPLPKEMVKGVLRE